MAWMNKTVLQNVPVKIHVINKKDYGANILAFLTSPDDFSTNLQSYVWTFYKHHVFQCGQNDVQINIYNFPSSTEHVLCSARAAASSAPAMNY